MNWKTGLSMSQISLMESCALGLPSPPARLAFERILEKIAEGRPKFRFILVNEDGEVTGTNDELLATKARAAEGDNGLLIVDVVGGRLLDSDEIEEQKNVWPYDEENSDDE